MVGCIESEEYTESEKRDIEEGRKAFLSSESVINLENQLMEKIEGSRNYKDVYGPNTKFKPKKRYLFLDSDSDCTIPDLIISFSVLHTSGSETFKEKGVIEAYTSLWGLASVLYIHDTNTKLTPIGYGARISEDEFRKQCNRGIFFRIEYNADGRFVDREYTTLTMSNFSNQNNS